MSLIWALLPDEFLVLVIAGIGLALMLRIISGRAAAGLLGGLVLMLLAAPFIEAMTAALPAWLLVLLTVAFALSLLRGLSNLLIGTHATNHMVGALAAQVVVGTLRLVFLPVTLLWRAVVRR